ncbi:hypothetical protein M378DRAFT_765891 [Amanita muscaria Koide BX008]|uniref:Uncharacterized protein n=1 Tax=Amanita muscaria (strain Koide BX008) TaxID=946122 RepID=A0A0C2TPJ6_AMAMK|nr:hypothetical protein M378DRAFT_765891 [Amanita muscaria Koide BX008]
MSCGKATASPAQQHNLRSQKSIHWAQISPSPFQTRLPHGHSLQRSNGSTLEYFNSQFVAYGFPHRQIFIRWRLQRNAEHGEKVT